MIPMARMWTLCTVGTTHIRLASQTLRLVAVSASLNAVSVSIVLSRERRTHYARHRPFVVWPVAV